MNCEVCGADNPERAKFCLECGAEIGALPAREVRKTVTVVFCDVTGSTALGERLDPEPLRALLARYFERMSEIVERHGGSVEKFIGDAVMAVFGVPQLHEDDALRAVRAAVEMRAALPELGVQARIGVNTGEVVVGTEERLATGDAVNVAARLEQSAGAGEVLLGPETARLVRDAVETEELQLELKGKSEPLAAHRLLALHEEAPAFARRLDAPLVGRERELRRLQEAFAQAVDDRSCQLFTLLGVAGVGKSRLTAEFLGAAGEATIVRGRCLPYGEGITYWPVIEILKQLPPAAELGLEAAAVGVVERLLGEDDAAGSSEEIPWAVRKLLEQAAESRPVVAVFDDIHWGEPTFLDLLEHVADLSREAPILLLCIARPELLDKRQGWGGGKLNATTLLLEPLSSAETDELLERLLGDSALEPGLQQRIRDAAEGNPLFLEEMVGLVEDSVDGEVAVPGTIQALLAARIDQLEPAERGVLERGSVEGRVFHRGAVQALSPDETQIETRLNGLVRKELVRPDKAQLPGEDAYRFRHLLIRDAAYEALPKATRAALHERFANWLEEHGVGLVELDEIVGYHLEQAHRYQTELGSAEAELGRRAAARLAAAGHRSYAAGDDKATTKLLGRAVALEEPTGPEGLETLFRLAWSLAWCGEFAEARARYEQAVELADVVGDRALELRAQCALTYLGTTTDVNVTAEEAVALGHETVTELQETGNEGALATAWNLIAMGENLRAHWEGVQLALEHVIEHAARAGDRRLEMDALHMLPPSLFWGPTPLSEGLPRAESQLERVRGRKSIESSALSAVAGYYAMQGRFDEARELVAKARANREELAQHQGLQTLAGFWAAPLEMLAGDPAAAEAHLRPACEYFQARGEQGLLSTLSAFLAEALYAQGRFDDARRWADVSRETATSDDYNAQGMGRAIEAKLLARAEKFDEAETRAREAIELVDRSDELDTQANVRLGLVEVYRLAGRNDDAVAALDNAIERFERKGNVVMTERTHALREELSARRP